MKIYIQMKAAGKRKPVLQHVPYELPEHVSTLRELLKELVRIEVERYNEKGTDVQVVPYLTKEEIGDQAEAGKVSFGRIYSENRADFTKASENALQCFKDGLVRVFQNDRELERLDDPIRIRDGAGFTLIRLTFLAGRLW